MQTLYISDLPMPGNVEVTWPIAETVLENWTSGRLGLDLSVDGSDVRNTHMGTSGNSSLYTGADGSRLRLLRTRKVDPARPLWAYDVTVWLGHDMQTAPEQSILRVRLTAHALHGRVAELPPPGAPGIVRIMLDEHHITADGYRLGQPREIGRDDVAELAAHLYDANRRRPTLVLTPSSSSGQPPIDPARTAQRLAGLAHVVVLTDRATSYDLTSALGGTDLSVFGGAARLYWPGLQPEARRTEHPLWFADRLTIGGPNHFAAKLFARLGRISALNLGPPPLETRLRKEADRARAMATAAQIDVLTQQYNDALRERALAEARAAEVQAAGSVEEVIDEDWFAEHEKISDELEQTATERDDLQAQLEVMQSELDQAMENIRQMAMAMSSGVPVGIEESADEDLDGSPAPTTVLVAVKQAQATCSYLEILPQALTSAAASEYPNPGQVLTDLRALDQVAAAWASDAIPGGFGPALTEHGISGFRPGISSTARSQYLADYERSYQGEKIVLGPHVAHGTGPVTTIMRIYWYADDVNKIFVIGHVGKKLRDDSNP